MNGRRSSLEETESRSITITNAVYFEHVLSFLKVGKSVLISVCGASMKPFLKDGDRVLIVPIGDKPKKGTIVLAKHNGKMILHRIVKIGNGLVLLAGDGNLVQVEKISESDIYAVAIEATRNGRTWSIDCSYRLCAGLAWYRFRFLRRLFYSIYKKIIM